MPMADSRYPIADGPGSLRLRRRVAFAETDAAGIVHFSNYFRYFEDAEHALWREAGLSIHEMAGPIGWPRVSAGCDYRRPLRFEQEFEVSVAIAEMSKRTIRYAGAITSDGERVATAAWKIACVAKQPDGSMRSTEIPAHIRERLEPYVHRLSDIGHRSSSAQ
jgi:YbgC/YbaW family acyl-CoA thioester hydrolase